MMNKIKDSNGLLEGILKCARSSSYRRKYAHLIWKLYKVKCIKIVNSREYEAMNLTQHHPGGIGLKNSLKKTNLKISSHWKKAKIRRVLLHLGGKLSETVREKIDNRCDKLIEFPKVCDVLDNLPVDHPLNPSASDIKSFLEDLVNVKAGWKNPWQVKDSH